jgi:hypothetical protein
MKLFRPLTLCALLLAGLATPHIAPATEGPAAIRQVIAEKGDAVIRIEVVQDVKASYGGQQYDRENRDEIVGFVIDADGLVVTSLSKVDPGSFYGALSSDEERFTTRVKSVKYLLADGSEVPAAVVLQDTDSDLAFLKPLAKPGAPMPFLTLNADHAGEVLEPVYTISRLGKIGRRTIAAMSGEIQAVITRPRKQFIPHGELATGGPGNPIMSANGQCIGMGAMYAFPGGRRTLGQNDEPVMFVILPAAEIARKAAEAKTIEPKAPAVEEAAPVAPAETTDGGGVPAATRSE